MRMNGATLIQKLEERIPEVLLRGFAFAKEV